MVRYLLLFGWVVILCACGGEENSSGTLSSTSSSSSTSSTSSSSSTGGLAQCESSPGSSSTSSSGSPYYMHPVYLLTITRENDRLVTLNGDFEDAQHPNYNSNPLYVYSGEGSGHFKGRAFSAAVADTDLGKPNIRFWIYSVADEPLEYSIRIDSVSYLCGGTSHNWGWQFSARDFEKTFVVHPHIWQQILLPLWDAVGNQHIRMVIHQTDNPTSIMSEFFLDDLGFHYSD